MSAVLTETPVENVNQEKKKTIVVLGAGVIGLTTALKLQETGLYQVEILAEVLPTDPKTIKYTSQWAGAHFVSLAPSGTLNGDIDHETFQEMWKLSETNGEAEHCFLRLPQTEYYLSEISNPNPLWRMPSFRETDKENLFPHTPYGYSFETVTIDVPIYLNYLFSRFLSKGGTVVRGHVQHIDQVLEAGTAPYKEEKPAGEFFASPYAVIICAGLGARLLGGVEDKSVYPSRGQTVILRAPWVRFGRSLKGRDGWTYIIPRKGGDVIVGGTQGIDDWYPKARTETTEDILKRALALCPELIPTEMRSERPSEVKDLLPIIVEEACGLRPMRNGGFRIELDYIKTSQGREVPVVYNYGHGAQGFISSIGSANHVLKLIKEIKA